MPIRSFHTRNGNQFCMYIPKDMIRDLGWEEQDRIVAEVEGRTVIFYKDNKLPTKLKLCNKTYLISLPIIPPKDTRGRLNVKKVGETIVVKFL
ncbi:hypothetical protein KAR91_06555 [Candidatus Pacearchaeota archaeon]|nr:hypothetical protein [Candidatus Pacearchaeota archaeon]